MARTHDNNGNLKDDGTWVFSYDFEDRLVQVRQSGTLTLIADYHYDALGRRVEKVLAAGTTTRYLLDGVEVVEEYDAVGNWQARYIYEDGIDRPRSMDRADIADVNGNQNTTEVLRFHYHQQALGSVTEVTQPTGAVVEWVTYDVYGLPAIRDQQGNGITQSAIGNAYLYTGREYDAESSLYFCRARHLDPSSGRFVQRDPLGYTDSLNAHEYAGSDPASETDPTGQYSFRTSPSQLPPSQRAAEEKLKKEFMEAAAVAQELLAWLLGLQNTDAKFKARICKHWDAQRGRKSLGDFFEEPSSPNNQGTPQVWLQAAIPGAKMAYDPRTDRLYVSSSIMRSNFWNRVMSIMHEFMHYAVHRMGHTGENGKKRDNADGSEMEDGDEKKDLGDVFEKVAKEIADDLEMKEGRLPPPPPEDKEDPRSSRPDTDRESVTAERLYRLMKRQKEAAKGRR